LTEAKAALPTTSQAVGAAASSALLAAPACATPGAAPSAGGGYLSPKFEGFVGEAQVRVHLDEGSIRLTKSGVAADLIISEGGADVKYNVYLRNDILLQFRSTDRDRAELAARLLKLAGVDAEVKKEGGEDE